MIKKFLFFVVVLTSLPALSFAKKTTTKDAVFSSLRKLKGTALCETLLPKDEVKRITGEVITEVAFNNASEICIYKRDQTKAKKPENAFEKLGQDLEDTFDRPVITLSVVTEDGKEYFTDKLSYVQETLPDTKETYPDAQIAEIAGVGDRAFASYLDKFTVGLMWLSREWSFGLSVLNAKRVNKDAKAQRQMTLDLAQSIDRRFRKYR